MSGTPRLLRRIALCVLVMLLGVAPLQALLGCSGPDRYRVLSFFLDGVPDPDAVSAESPGSTVRVGKQGQTYFIHKPLIEGACSQCHQNSPTAIASGKISLPPEICRQCHANVDEKIPVVHGPVASNQCVACHSPHRSTVPHLLKVGGSKLCLQCHLPFDLSTRVAEHSDTQIDCMSCHDAHGGATRALLKPAPPASQPTSVASGDQGEEGDFPQ